MAQVQGLVALLSNPCCRGMMNPLQGPVLEFLPLHLAIEHVSHAQACHEPAGNWAP